MNESFKLTEANRRIANLICFGTVKEVDYSKGIAKIEIGELVTAWLPWVAGRAGGNISSSPLEVDEQVVVLSPSGEMNQGVVLPALHQNRFPANANKDKHTMTYADGCVLEYDRAAHHLKAVLPQGGTIELIGDLTVTGNIKATGDITDKTRSMQADRDIYNQHDHADPQGGKVNQTAQQQ